MFDQECEDVVKGTAVQIAAQPNALVSSLDHATLAAFRLAIVGNGV